MSESRSIEQRRADFALGKIRAYQKESAGKDKDLSLYQSYVSSFAAHVLIGGLGQAAATLLAQAKGDNTPHKALYGHLSAWLCGGDTQSPYQARGGDDLIEQLMANDQATYLVAQAEALQYLEWLKRFAVAFYPKVQDGEP